MIFPVSPEKQKQIEERMKSLGLREQDLVEEFVKGSGPGGQKINKTSSVVLLRHKTLGLVVRCQASRSQAMNRYLARRILLDRLEAKISGEKTKEESRREKIRRQKRRRSRRSKERMLANKHLRSEKKQLRQKPLDFS